MYTAIRSRFKTFSPFSRQLPSMAWILAGTAFINRMGAMAKLFMAIYLRETLQLDLATIGILLSCYGAGTLIGSFGLGVASDHISARKLAVACLFSSGLNLVLLSLLHDPILLGLFLIMGGISDAGYRPLVQRLIMDACPATEQPRAQALHRVAINLGFAVGGMLGGMLAGFDYRWVFWSDALTSCLAGTWLYFALKHYAPPQLTQVVQSKHAQAALSSPYKDYPFLCLLLAALPVGIMYDQVNGLYGAYLREHLGLSPAQVGWQYGLNGLLVALLQIPLTQWSERLGAGRQMVIGVLFAGLGLGLQPLAPHVAWVLVLTAVWTVGEMLFMPTLAIIVMRRAQGRASGHYLGLNSAMWAVSTLTAPLLGSQIYGRFGGDALWWSILASALPVMLVLGWAAQRLQAGQEGNQDE